MTDNSELYFCLNNSYQFPDEESRAILNGAIAVLYDIENGTNTAIFYFCEEEIAAAEAEYEGNLKYSVERFNFI